MIFSNLQPARYSLLPDDFHARIKLQPLNNPYLVAVSQDMATTLNIEPSKFAQKDAIAALSGSSAIGTIAPYAAIYAGHQFGHYVPQLGDGRAITLGEVTDSAGALWELQLKGAGVTPFSRMGDGRAVLRSSIREFLCSEAMAGLGIATTRALCITGSADPVYRERVESSAVLTRLAPSHLRFGSFELFFYRQRYDCLKQLADFVIEHFYPWCQTTENPYLTLLNAVMHKTAKMIADWQLIGFTHGVMNSDNMSILGLTIDYGPFGFIDQFRSDFVCNHTDIHGRYAFNQQPQVGLFNLSCWAQTLLPLIDEKDSARAATKAKEQLEQYQTIYTDYYEQGMRKKLGLLEARTTDSVLAADLIGLMERAVDYTRFFRRLAEFDEHRPLSCPGDLFEDRSKFDAWANRYRERLVAEASDPRKRRQQMRAVNPKYILRNYLAHQAIVEAEKGDYSGVENLLQVLSRPFDDAEQHERYANEPPDWSRTLELSCSS